MDKIKELKSLKELFESGAITDKELKVLKDEILKRDVLSNDIRGGSTIEQVFFYNADETHNQGNSPESEADSKSKIAKESNRSSHTKDLVTTLSLIFIIATVIIVVILYNKTTSKPIEIVSSKPAEEKYQEKSVAVNDGEASGLGELNNPSYLEESDNHEMTMVDSPDLYDSSVVQGTYNTDVEFVNTTNEYLNSDDSMNYSEEPETEVKSEMNVIPRLGVGSLNMAGWRYSPELQEDPYGNETGEIIFIINVDAKGKLLSLSVSESTVSQHFVDWYLEQIQKCTFSKVESNTSNAVASGLITLRLRAK